MSDLNTTPAQLDEWLADAKRTVGMSPHPTPARVKAEQIIALGQDVKELTRQRDELISPERDTTGLTAGDRRAWDDLLQRWKAAEAALARVKARWESYHDERTRAVCVCLGCRMAEAAGFREVRGEGDRG